MRMTTEQTIQFLKRIAEVIKERRGELTDLDAAVGDADHGSNLDRGFSAVVSKLATVEDKDMGTVLKTVGMTLISTVGGASGPLYGTAFIRAANSLNDVHEASDQQIIAALEAALEGVKTRGKAQTGEKTMIDAIAPGVELLKAELPNDDLSVDVYRRALAAVEEGMRATTPMQATKGRASYLGERSIGHQDPGATSAFYIAQALFETLAAEA